MSSKHWLDRLQWDQNSLQDLRSIAYSYVQQGIYDVALTFFEALIIVDPAKAYDLQTIGAIHLQMGHALKALDYLDRALKLEPHHTITQLNRARALFMLGYKRQGISAAVELKKSPDTKIADQAEALLLAYT